MRILLCLPFLWGHQGLMFCCQSCTKGYSYCSHWYFNWKNAGWLPYNSCSPYCVSHSWCLLLPPLPIVHMDSSMWPISGANCYCAHRGSLALGQSKNWPAILWWKPSLSTLVLVFDQQISPDEGFNTSGILRVWQAPVSTLKKVIMRQSYVIMNWWTEPTHKNITWLSSYDTSVLRAFQSSLLWINKHSCDSTALKFEEESFITRNLTYT